MTVIIVDDEPKAIELVASYLSHFSSFELVKTFRNALKALNYLNGNSVDVVFLDINMPHLSGLSLSKMIDVKTAIVFTTAYAEYAVESYELNAMDYLLKPISLTRFSQTMTKLMEALHQQKIVNKEEELNTIFVKSGLETRQLKLASIDYLQKDGNYIYYLSQGEKIMVRQSIAEALSMLNVDFIQIHKSYIVNFKKVTSIATEFVKIGTIQLPVGAQYKQVLQAKIKHQ